MPGARAVRRPLAALACAGLAAVAAAGCGGETTITVTAPPQTVVQTEVQTTTAPAQTVVEREVTVKTTTVRSTTTEVRTTVPPDVAVGAIQAIASPQIGAGNKVIDLAQSSAGGSRDSQLLAADTATAAAASARQAAETLGSKKYSARFAASMSTLIAALDAQAAATGRVATALRAGNVTPARIQPQLTALTDATAATQRALAAVEAAGQ